MDSGITRRSFIKTSGIVGLNAFLGSPLVPDIGFGAEKTDLAVVKGRDYFNNTGKAVAMLGGMQRFVPEGAKVALLPNPSSSNPGAFTNPQIVRAVIHLCREAGAAEIACIGWLTMRDWKNCGMKRVLDDEAVNLIITDYRDESQFRPIPVPAGIGIKEARILNTCFDYDVLIDIPITKEHSGNKYSGALKNLMGLNSPKSCQTFHKRTWILGSDNIEHLEQCIADLNTIIQPDLCIVDATEFLISNGPYGPGDLSRPQKIIAGVDRVAIDAYCATLFGLQPGEVYAVQRAYAHGLGEMDLSKLNIREVET